MRTLLSCILGIGLGLSLHSQPAMAQDGACCLEEKDDQIETLRNENAAMQKKNSAMEARLARLERLLAADKENIQ